MPLPKTAHLDNVGVVHKSDNMKGIKAMLEKAKQDLEVAQKANNVARIKRLQETILDLTKTIERNS